MREFYTESGRTISYRGRGIKCCPVDNKYGDKIQSLDDLFGLLLDCWCRETAYPPCQEEYDHEKDPTCGQCAITATIIHDIFGGDVIKIRQNNGATHYFNRIDGNYIDLTSDQFDLYGIKYDSEPNIVIPRKYYNNSPDTKKRYRLLLDLLELRLLGISVK